MIFMINYTITWSNFLLQPLIDKINHIIALYMTINLSYSYGMDA